MGQRAMWRAEDLQAPLKDDRAFAAARKRKRKRPPAAPPDDGGPRCARCGWWDAPGDGERYGSCRAIAATTRRGGAREIMPMEDATKLAVAGALLSLEELRCAAWFGCPRYAAKEGA